MTANTSPLPPIRLAPALCGDRRRAVNERVRQHHQHLDALTGTLRKLGVEDAAINQHVTEILEKYKTELLRNIDRT